MTRQSPAQPPLEARTALITGASAGIGHQTAVHLADLGARVILNARREQRLLDLAQQLDDQYPLSDGSPRAFVLPGDAADQSVIDAALAPDGRSGRPVPDLVVVNAGRGLAGSVLTSDRDQWDEMIRTNYLGAAALIRSAGNALATLQEKREWPRGGAADIVIVGSTVGRHISPFSSMYGSTKAAVHALAESARRELAPKGVRVSLVEPGIVRTEFQGVAGYDERSFGEKMESIAPVLTPADIARAIGFIVSQPPGVSVSDLVVRPTKQDYP